MPFDHLAVQRDSLPGADQEHLAGFYLFGRDDLRGAVGDDFGFRRHHFHQRRHGASGPGHAPGFQRKREGEQERNRRGFEPLPDQQRAGYGHAHQQVHVGPKMAQGQPHLGSQRSQPAQYGQQIENGHGPGERQPLPDPPRGFFAQAGRGQPGVQHHAGQPADARDGRQHHLPPGPLKRHARRRLLVFQQLGFQP